MDDVGPATPSSYGGEIQTPTLDRVAKMGVSFNRFHTTAMCSPTRASLLTGRNHTRVGNGQIAAIANDFDGFSGVIPKSSATVSEVLKNYGYNTGAWGKWHNTPEEHCSSKGPFEFWPTGYGFEYFYGFLAGEASQYEPNMVRGTSYVKQHHKEGYHLTEDIAEDAIQWLREQRAYSPDKPFLMYWAPGAAHGPHHIMKERADKYKGKFDDGWDAYRERVHRRQIEMGIIPPGTKLTPRDETMAAWADIPENQRAFQRRGMELFAGFVEHTDVQVGRIVDGLEQRGLRENTLILYIVGDNGSSSEGQQGSISELLAQNNIPNTVEQQLAALEKLGGLDVLGSPKTDNMYHAGWAWAGCTPFRSTKLVAAHFGGTRNPLVISWPKGIKPDATMRSQFTHCVDIAPTIYDLLKITPPRTVNGHGQMQIDGHSFAAAFHQSDAPATNTEQFFDNNGSRAIYKDGWMACAFGPLYPWNTPASLPRLSKWDSATDEWELYDLKNDFSQANNLASANPAKLADLQKEFLALAEDNHAFPIGAGNWLRLRPQDRVSTPYRSWTFTESTRRMPEFTAPGLGRESNVVEIDMECGENASGVLYALGGSGGGLALYLDKGHIVYLYNMMIIEQYEARSAQPLAAGKHKIVVDTSIAGPGKEGTVVITVDDKEVGTTKLKRTVPAAFTASESFDVGVDLGSTVADAYFERRPFNFDGQIKKVSVNLR